MLEAFIIEEIQKREQAQQWRPVSLPAGASVTCLEDYTEGKEDKSQDLPATKLVFRF